MQRRREEGKNFLGAEKFFQAQAFQTELQARYSTMPGLLTFFCVALGCKRGGRKKRTFYAPKSFFWFRGPKQGSTGKTSQDKPNASQGQHLKADGLSESSRCRAQAVAYNLSAQDVVRLTGAPPEDSTAVSCMPHSLQPANESRHLLAFLHTCAA